MARKLLHQAVLIATAVAMAAATFFGLSIWRRSGDATWCRQAAAEGLTGDGRPAAADILEEIRSACVTQRQRQRVILGAVWRTGGQQTARCGFELARMQLVSFSDPVAYRALLQPYGLDDPEFEISNRTDQDRFVQACISFRRDGAG